MIAYFDCFSGISGDMTLGALIDLGVPPEWLQDQLSGLPLEAFRFDVQKVHRNGIGANLVEVVCGPNPKERSYADITSLIEQSTLPDSVKTTSLQIFGRLARAEAGVHGCDVADVHFHEVGATDAIVDIVGAALGVDYLEITEVYASRLPLGTGFVDCRHGRIPVPAPATVALLENIPVVGTDITAELVTPTGAAIITTVGSSFGTQPPMRINRCGYGAGQRELAPGPNLLRVMLGQLDGAADTQEIGFQQDQVWVLETAVDDMNPEQLGYCIDLFLADGALDVAMVPVYMKKNRPGTLLQVICRERQKEALLKRILTETTTLGVRLNRAERRIVARDTISVDTTYGKIAVKRIQMPGGGVRLVPEYEVCRQIAQRRQLPLRVVYETVMKDAVESESS